MLLMLIIVVFFGSISIVEISKNPETHKIKVEGCYKGWDKNSNETGNFWGKTDCYKK